jgi:hypothetical protein
MSVSLKTSGDCGRGRTLVIPSGLIPRSLSQTVSWSNGFGLFVAAAVTPLATAAAKNKKTTARSPWLQKGNRWNAGDLARAWFDQMPRSFPGGSLLIFRFPQTSARAEVEPPPSAAQLQALTFALSTPCDPCHHRINKQRPEPIRSANNPRRASGTGLTLSPT